MKAESPNAAACLLPYQLKAGIHEINFSTNNNKTLRRAQAPARPTAPSTTGWQPASLLLEPGSQAP